MALSLKQKLFDYFAQRHFDLMSPEQRARFDDFAKNADFQGHMSDWNKLFKGSLLPDLKNGAVAGSGVTNEHQLTDEEWGDLYDAYQEAFQNMDIEKIPPIGFDSEYKKATKDFIAKWFGSFADGKVFIPKEATSVAENILSPATPTSPLAPNDHLADFLEAHQEFKTIFKRNLKETFSDISYKDFIEGLKNKRYNFDTKFRAKVIDVVEYIRDYGPREGYQTPPRSQWPENVGYTSTDLGDGTFVVNPGSIPTVINNIYTNSDTDKWFEIPAANRTTCIDRFKDKYTYIFDTLLKESKVREHFLAQTNKKIISEPLNEALRQTDYENKNSKDYLEPKYPDEKNWLQRLGDWKDDTYENYFRRFVEPARGSVKFNNPWTLNIMKAFDKVKIKPTDGLEGILAKKSDILAKLKSSKTSSDHFEWFTKTIETLKNSGMGKAVEGALRNGNQLRQVAIGIITEAIESKPQKLAEAESALEILSVAKYGLLTSRTMDAINKTDVNIFSDGKLSWNKNEGIQTVTKVVDRTIKTGIQAVGYAATGAYNFIQHRRTKIDRDIRNNPILKKAYDKWLGEDKKKIAQKKLDDANEALANLAAGHGKSRVTIKNAATLAAAESALAAVPTGTTTVTVAGITCSVENLQKYIDLYKQSILDQLNANTEITNINNNDAHTASNTEKDPFARLIDYWNRLETFSKCHSFTLGSMKIKRDEYLKGYDKNNDKNKSKAREEYNEHLRQFLLSGGLRTA